MKRLFHLSEIMPWRPGASVRIDFPTELFGALIAAILVIPQGITFAYLAGLPPEYGIYTSIFVTLFASLFGTSAMLGGPNTAVAILIGMAVVPYAGRGSPLYIDYVLLLSFMVGLIQLAIWLMRGGRYFQYLSPAAVTGITVGVGVILVLSSLDGILGLSTAQTLFFFEKLYILFTGSDELINGYSAGIGLLTVASGLLARQYKPRYAILIAMSVGYAAGLVVLLLFPQVETEVELLGHVPIQLLPLSHPKLDLEYLMVGFSLLPDALVIALIGLAQSMVIIKHQRSSAEQSIDLDKEVFAQGIANTLAAFFSSFAGSGSFNRTAVNQSLGVKTPLAGILSGVIVMGLILLFGPLLTYLPMAVISGTLMLVGIGMIKTQEIFRLFGWKGELSVFTLTLLAIVVIDLQTGLIVAISLSILLFVLKASKLKLKVTQGQECVQLQVEGHLFYASIDQLSDMMKRYRQENLKLDLSVVSYLDLSATEAIAKELRHRDNEMTSFVIVLTSESLLAHFEERMAGLPVQFVQHAYA